MTRPTERRSPDLNRHNSAAAQRRALLLVLGASIAIACGSSDTVKRPFPGHGAGADGGETTGGAPAAASSSDAGDAPDFAGAAPGTGGTPAMGDAGTGAGTSEAGQVSGGSPHSLGGAGGSPENAGAAGEAGAPSCYGDPCSCVQQIYGSAVVRADGRLLIVQNGAQVPVRSAVTDEPLDRVTSAWPGQYLGCAVRDDGSVWCWANQADGNSKGLLGTGVGMAVVNPYTAYQVQVDPGNQPGPTYLRDVRAFHHGNAGGGGAVLCAVTHAGSLFCWGPTQLNGDLPQTGQDEPYARQIHASKDAFVTDAVELAAGYRHACYTNAKGEVYCWGTNIDGPLGNGSTADAKYPVRAGTLSGISKLVAGTDYTCALVGAGAQAGQVHCWGTNFQSQLGIGPPTENTDAGCLCKKAPIRVRTGPSAYLDEVIDLAAGTETSCALRRDGSVWCWGAVSGNYAVPLEAPSGTPLSQVVLLGVQTDDPRVLLANGSYLSIRVNQERTTIAINCAAVN